MMRRRKAAVKLNIDDVIRIPELDDEYHRIIGLQRDPHHLISIHVIIADGDNTLEFELPAFKEFVLYNDRRSPL